jgi:hypothetical protein
MLPPNDEPASAGWTLEMAHFLDSTVWKSFPTREAENARGQGNRRFQMSKAIFMDGLSWKSRAARWRVEPSSDEWAPAVVSHPVELTLPLHIARCIDHP